MRKFFGLIILFLGLLGGVGTAHAAPVVELVKVCSLFGAGFYYIPGTDICFQPITGDTREETPGGTWRSLLPYPEGNWVSNPSQECGLGQLVKVGAFQSTDFSENIQTRKVTAPVSLPLSSNQFISKVMMSGGFYDPRLPTRRAVNGAGLPPTDGLCIKVADPDANLTSGGGATYNPGYANLALGCISNSRIANVPQVYSIAATQAYPQILVDQLFNTFAPSVVFGDQLLVTTDFGETGQGALTYCDPTAGSCAPGDIDFNTLMVTTPNGPGLKPLAGTLNVWVCVAGGNQ